MKFYKVVEFDEEKDSSAIEKLRAAKPIIERLVPVSAHGRLDEVLYIVQPVCIEALHDFSKACRYAAEITASSPREKATLRTAEQLCESILKQLGSSDPASRSINAPCAG